MTCNNLFFPQAQFNNYDDNAYILSNETVAYVLRALLRVLAVALNNKTNSKQHCFKRKDRNQTKQNMFWLIFTLFTYFARNECCLFSGFFG